ncbi:MAG TPA: tRNA glutamyl-Q(34) synthetase GluQRS [Polyangiaceae bacterium]|nr:tRNA glutamyl-Q(34) synthetase GluQRS [Polyangiaceae bacterium]HNZ20691.1 tRNA glutamyl-Q(34) synthetase GluQRS [Polyangiaceae bacterium]HOD20693.1 tRNA glutamyl-Q(34) synthetase GluQRS [Polyangiaceae bacterium]HOE47113.1 tRNA glutamyl-Q(34) synthetase GluQRS [Polyangiaceae bacterium]HOG99221.1 tRNA glutamyl-Q(34) synthetase GluQRS [Polyangiaceae bacterium]
MEASGARDLNVRYRGRFAPSPTGDLHLGGASTALCAWLAARSVGGSIVLRIEDIDTPRVRPDSEKHILEDLRWLGLDWDEEPEGILHQSQRTRAYESALQQLENGGFTYPCDCSRKEISLASAPSGNEKTPIYPGSCRQLTQSRSFRRPPATRLRIPPNTFIEFEDAVFGKQSSQLSQDVGDFVLRRGDGVFAYQLAVVVDDLAQGITHVVRGADLLSSTARQIFLMRCLGTEPPSYAHAPLWVGPNGEKLAKRASGIPVRDHRNAGVDPRKLIARLAQALGLADQNEPWLTPHELIPRFSWGKITKGPIEIDPSRDSLPL